VAEFWCITPLFHPLWAVQGKMAIFWSFSSAVQRRGGGKGMKKILYVYFRELSISMHLIYSKGGLGGAVGVVAKLLTHPL